MGTKEAKKENRFNSKKWHDYFSLDNGLVYILLVSIVLISYLFCSIQKSGLGVNNTVFIKSFEQSSEVLDLSQYWRVESQDLRYIVDLKNNFPLKTGEKMKFSFILPDKIDRDDVIILRATYATIKVTLNGKILYEYSKDLATNLDTIYRNWHAFELQQSYANEILDIEIQQLSSSNRLHIRDIYLGNPYAVRDYLFLKKAPQIFFALVLVFTGLVLILTRLLSLFANRNIHNGVWLGATLVSFGVFSLCEGAFLNAFLSYPSVLHVLFVSSLTLVPLFYSIYIKNSTLNYYEVYVNGLIGLSMLMQGVVIFNLWFDYFQTSLIIFINSILILCAFILHMLRALRTYSHNVYIKKLFIWFGMFYSIMLVCFLYSLLTYCISGIAEIEILQIVVFLFVLTLLGIDSIEATLKSDNERTLSSRMTTQLVSTAISQIKPHFLYNTLTSIKALIKTEPEEAYSLISDFSDYLRSNFSALNRQELIPIEEEIGHIRVYFRIEKKRFGERVNLVMDIKDKNIKIPALSLQPLIENAIKHGICKKLEGGTVFMRTYMTLGHHVIEIKDDGVGFSLKNVFKDQNDFANEHVGIKNSFYRLEQMCSAKINVKTQPNQGCFIMIKLPREEKV